MFKIKATLVVLLILLTFATFIAYAGTQFPGQIDGQAAAIANTFNDSGPRVFSGAGLNKINYPLAGLGTGIIYFNGGAKPVRWDIGTLGDPGLMADNSLFAIRVNNSGFINTRKLQANVNNTAFINQPTASTRLNGMNKQGVFFIGTTEVSPGFTTFDDNRKGVLESNAFVLPSTCTKITALVGGGNDIKHEYLALVEAGNNSVLCSLTGDNNEAMVTKTMNLGAQYAGKTVIFRMVDDSTTGWGHLNIDNIQLKNSGDQVVDSAFVNGDFETGDLTGWKIKNNILPGGYSDAVVTLEYPIAKYLFKDPAMAVDAELEMLNPMIPLNEKDSAIPAGVFNLKLTNKTGNKVSVAVLSALANGLKGVNRTNNAVGNSNGTYVTMNSSGFTDGTMEEGSLCLWTNAAGATYSAGNSSVDNLLKQITFTGKLDGVATGNQNTPVAGVCAPLTLAAGESKTVSFTWSWYFPHMPGNVIWGSDTTDVSRRYVNYYTNVTQVMQDVKKRWDVVVSRTKLYHDTMYDSNLPYYLIDAVTANSDIMRSPTMFVTKNGEIYAWEGSDGSGGSGNWYGNCMHVWNYAETMANLYPEMARRWKTMDFTRRQSSNGLLNNRIASIPASLKLFGEEAAIDGILGTVLEAYREHLNAPDNSFLSSLWGKIKAAMDGAIATWDPNCDGVNENTANTTFDGPIGGENSFIGAQYLAALRAAEKMAAIMGDNTAADTYRNLYTSGSNKLSKDTFNGEYFRQVDADQYGPGLLTDHLLGQTHAFLSQLGYLLPEEQVKSSAYAIFKYNFFSPIGDRYKPENGDLFRVMARPDDDGLLTCTFPNGGSGNALYLSEDWPGFDYEVATDLLYLGMADQALAIVHAVRSRQDGKDYDPLSERESGGYYARSLASYGVLVAATGIEKNGPQKMLGFKPNYQPDNIKAFFTDVNGWGSFQQTRTVVGSITTQVDRITMKYGALNLRTLQFYIPDNLVPNITNIHSVVKVNGKPVSAIQKVNGNQVVLTFAADTPVGTGSNVETVITATENGGGTFKSNLSGWSVVNGTWTNASNGKQGSGSGDVFYLAGNSGSNFIYEGDLKLTTSGSIAAGLVFRAGSNPVNGSYVVNINRDFGGQVKFFKFPYAPIATYNIPITPGAVYHLKIVATGCNFKVYFNYSSAPVIDANDSTYASGRFGLNAYNSTSVFQNIIKN